jgi:ATP-dependent phosphoenolpyruvate carboxykinase
VDVGTRFEALVDALAAEPGVQQPGSTGSRGFGSGALRLDGAVFAMVVAGRVVLKLPAERVAGLIATGAGGAFAIGTRRPMREWVTLLDEDPATTLTLGREALAFARARG